MINNLILNKSLLVLVFLLSSSFKNLSAQKSTLPKYIIEDKKNIVGTWISEEDNNWKRVFTIDGRCYDYYSGKLKGTLTYKISNSSPQCGDSVLVDEKQETEYLELTDLKEGDKICYEINGVSDLLSLRYLGRGNLIVMRRSKSSIHYRKKK